MATTLDAPIDPRSLAARPAMVMHRHGPPPRVERSLRRDRRLIAELAERLVTSLDLGAIMIETLRLLHDRFGYGNVAVFLPDRDRRLLRLRATYGDMVSAEHAYYRQTVEEGLIGAAFRSAALVRVDDVHRDARYLNRLAGARSEMCVPMIARGQVVGVLDVQVRVANAFHKADERLLRDIAERLAPAVHNAVLYEESERRAAELGVLADVARSISSQITPDAVLDEVHRQVGRIMPADGARVALRRDIVAAAWPSGQQNLVQAIPDPRELLLVRALRGAMRLHDAEGTELPLDEDALGAIARREPVLSDGRLIAPLLAGDDVLGLIALESSGIEPYDQWHARLLGTIANQAGVALHTSCLFALADGALGELQRSRQQVTAAEERLRREIAELLHSRVQSRLIVAWHRLGQCQRLLMTDPAEASRILADVRDEIDHVREQGLRQAAHLLHPAIIGVGLVPAIRSLTGRYGEAFAVEVEVAPAIARLDDPADNAIPEAMRLTAYRVLEEVLANVQRHAHAREVDVSLDLDANGRLRMIVRDDGRGFDPRTRRSGLGLVSIAGRVGQVGGTWSIESRPNGGTTVAVTLPIAARATAGPA